MPSGSLLVSTTPITGIPSLRASARRFFVPGIDDEQRVRQAAHLLDAAEAALEFFFSRRRVSASFC